MVIPPIRVEGTRHEYFYSRGKIPPWCDLPEPFRGNLFIRKGIDATDG
jgi:hypothetical protein